MLLLDLRDSLGRGNEIEEDDALVAELLQLRKRVACATASREHRVDHDCKFVVLRRRDFCVVGNRLGCCLVALHAEDSDLCVGKDTQHCVEHTHASPKNRHNHYRVLDLYACSLGDRSDNWNLDSTQVLQALDCKKLRNLVHELTELLWLCVDVAHQRDAMPDEWMIKDCMHGRVKSFELEYYTP